MANLQASGIKKFLHLSAFDKVTEDYPSFVDITPLFVYLIDSVPSSVLPFLAEQFDVLGYKGWRFADTEEKKRELIKRAIELHRFKGTPWSIREALKIIGFENTIIKERIPGNTYNSDWNHNGTISYNSPHWATFRVIIDATQYGILTAQQIADVIALVYEYKNARSLLVDVSFGYYLDDQPEYSDDSLHLVAEYSDQDDLSLVNYNGVFTHNAQVTYNGENDCLSYAFVGMSVVLLSASYNCASDSISLTFNHASSNTTMSFQLQKWTGSVWQTIETATISLSLGDQTHTTNTDANVFTILTSVLIGNDLMD